MRKDAEAIATFLADAAKGLVDEDLDRLVGWVLDNTKAICRAMLTLQERFPKWIMRGCFAHGLALLMNDFCNYKAATGRNAGARTYGMRWAETCTRDANTTPSPITFRTAAQRATWCAVSPVHIVVLLSVQCCCLLSSPYNHWISAVRVPSNYMFWLARDRCVFV
jgi:hypothetical protein